MDIQRKKSNLIIPSLITADAVAVMEKLFHNSKHPKALYNHFRFQPPPGF